MATIRPWLPVSPVEGALTLSTFLLERSGK